MKAAGFNDENNFPHKLLLINTQVTSFSSYKWFII